MSYFIWRRKAVCGIEVSFESHNQPDLDEVAASWLILEIATAEWISEHTRASDGVIPLGIDGEEFDEHAKGKGDNCCLTLVAESLGVKDDLLYSELIKHVVSVDVRGQGHSFYLYNLTKLGHRDPQYTPDEIINWAYMGLNFKLFEQKDFVPALEAARQGQKHLIQGKNRRVRVLLVRSDATTCMKAAQFDNELKPDVLVQIKSTGNVQMYRKASSGLKMFRVVRQLRLAEANKRGHEVARADLCNEGFAAGDSTWYYAVRGEMIMNGSITNPDVEPTKLTESEILACVEKGLLEFINN